jgi:replicative DNA helicase
MTSAEHAPTPEQPETPLGAAQSHETGQLVSFPGVQAPGGLADSLSSLEAEEEYAGAVLADPNTIILTRDMVSAKEFYWPKPRAIVQAAWSCMEHDPPYAVTMATVLDRLTEAGLFGTSKEQVGKHYLRAVQDRAVDSVVAAAQDNAGIVRKLYRARIVRKSALRLAELVEQGPDETDAHTEKATEHMLNTLALSSINRRDPSAKGIMETLDDSNGSFMPTGWAWLDSFIGGHRASHMYALLGTYKGRKTTAASNLVLKALWDNIPISIFTTDGTRREVINRFVSMMATTYMSSNEINPSEWTLGAKGLPVAYRTKAQHEAIEWAQAQLATRSLRVYDQADGIQDVDMLEAKLRRDGRLHPTLQGQCRETGHEWL